MSVVEQVHDGQRTGTSETTGHEVHSEEFPEVSLQAVPGIDQRSRNHDQTHLIRHADTDGSVQGALRAKLPNAVLLLFHPRFSF